MATKVKLSVQDKEIKKISVSLQKLVHLKERELSDAGISINYDQGGLK